MCTSVFWNTNPALLVVGRNEDFVTASHPTLVATPKGIHRFGTADGDAEAAEWTVRFGNVAIYANNRFPMDGLNEAGLTARTLFYVQGDPSQSMNPREETKQLDEDRWLAYVLDNFATVAEAVDALRHRVHVVAVQGAPGSGYSYATPKHLALADRTGDAAVVEIQDGELVVFHGPEYRILTNPPSYQEELANVGRYADVAAEELPSTWAGTDRFVRADYFLRNLPRPEADDASIAYGFMYSLLNACAMPAGLPAPEEDRALTAQLMDALTDPTESYGTMTYFQTISDLTNLHYRFKSVLAPSDVFVDMADLGLTEGQPVRTFQRIDRYAQIGVMGNVAPHLETIDGDIYDQPLV